MGWLDIFVTSISLDISISMISDMRLDAVLYLSEMQNMQFVTSSTVE